MKRVHLRARRSLRRSLCFLFALLTILAVLTGCQAEYAGIVESASPQPITSLDPASSALISDENGSRGVMWEVEAKEGTGKLYLLGSIHMADQGILPFDDTLTEAFYESDVLAVEYDITDQSNIMSTSLAMMYTDGTTLADHMSAETYQRLTDYMKNNDAAYPMYAVDQMNIGMIPSLLQGFLFMEEGILPDYGVDMLLLNAAKQDNMEIYELESEAGQMELLTGFPDRTQELQIISFLDNPELSLMSIKVYLSVWKSGDISVFEMDPEMTGEAAVYPGFSEEDIALITDYNEALLDDRNVGMIAQAKTLLERGDTCFYVVGAAHMVGETGIVEGLRKDGYTVNEMQY